MPKYKESRKAYREAWQEWYRAEEEEKRAEAEIEEAKSDAQILKQIVKECEKSKEAWQEIAETQEFGDWQKEIQNAAGEIHPYQDMEPNLLILANTLEEISVSESQLAILDQLAEEWNKDKTPEKQISREKLAEAQAAWDRKRQEESDSLKNASNLKEALQRQQEYFERTKSEERGKYYLSEKMHHGEEQMALRNKYKTSVSVMIKTMDAEITAKRYAETQANRDANKLIGVSSLEDFWYEEAMIRAKEAELENRKKEKKTLIIIPETVKDIELLGNGDERKETVRGWLTKYEVQRDMWAKAAQNAQRVEKSSKLVPETVKELEKLKTKKKKDYIEKAGQINSLFQQKLEEFSGNPKYQDYPKNLDEYFAEKKRCEEFSSRVITVEKKEQERQQKRFSEITKEIEGWFKAYNAQEKAKVEQAKEEEKAAKKEMNIAKESLEKAAKKYNSTCREQVNIEDRKLKKEIRQLKAIHKTHRKQLDTLISNYNKAHKEKKEALDKEVEAEKQQYSKSLVTLQEELDKESEKFYGSKTSAEEQEVIRQKKGLEELLSRENERREKHNLQVQQNNHDRMQLRGEASKRAEEHWDKMLEDSESEYTKAKMWRTTVGLAADGMDKITKKYRDMIVTLTDAVIKAELETAKEEKTKIEDEIKRKKAARKAKVNRLRQALPAYSGMMTSEEEERQGGSQNRAENLTEQLKEDTQRLARQNWEVEEIRRQQGQKILENHNAIDAALGAQSELDVEQEKKRIQHMKEIYQEAVGESEVRKRLAETRIAYEERETNDTILANDAEMRELEESIQSIEDTSEKVSPYLTDTMQKRITLAITVGQKVINFLMKKVSETSEESDKKSQELDLNATLEQLKEKLQEPSAQEQNTVIQNLLEVGKLLYPIMQEKNKEIRAIYEEALSVEQDKRDIYFHMKEAHDSFQLYQERSQKEASQKEADFVIDVVDFLDQKDEEAQIITEEQLHLREDIVRVAETREQFFENEVVKSKEEKKAEKEVLANQKHEAYETKEEEMRFAFAETINETKTVWEEKGEKQKLRLNDDMLLMKDVEVSKETDTEKSTEKYPFLSMLTGVDMHEGMNIEEAMDAFSRIYINGLNASAYFQLGERYPEAQEAGPEAQAELLKEMVHHAEEIKMALYHTVNPEVVGELPEEVRRLTGQFIAVEDEECMRLSPVVLSNDSPQCKDYNRISIMMTDSFNEMRVETANIELEKGSPEKRSQEKSSQEKSSQEKSPAPAVTKIDFQELSATERAIHTSRREALEARRAEKKAQKEQKPLIREMHR